MTILRTYLKDCVKKSMKNNVRCRVIGRREELSADIIESIENLEQKTKNNTGLQFTIAINYGGRDEITRESLPQRFQTTNLPRRILQKK